MSGREERSRAEGDEGGQPGESPKERVDRELGELLQELRVALPGAQVLFAFLLTVPFSNRFQDIGEAQRIAYFVSFALAALAVALLIAPSSYHRIRFRKGDKSRMLRSSNRMAIAGTVAVALSMTGVVYLITDLLFGIAAAAGVTAAIGLWFGWFWYGLPLVRKERDG